MYITRWLAGHPLIAIWVLGIVAILLSWPGIGGGKVHKPQSASEIHPLETQSGKVSSRQGDGREARAHMQDGAGQEVPDHNKPAIKDSAGVAVKSESTALPTQAKRLAQAAAPFKSEANSPVKTTTDTVQLSATEMSDTKATAVQDLSTMATDDMLVMAREAYWNNGLDEASQIYIKLIELEPDVLEHKGELGNVYWRQGYPKKAAELYSEIAIPMIKAGDGERVANMIGFIGLFFPDKAAEINRQLQAQKSNVH
jgi:hypothetical protein